MKKLAAVIGLVADLAPGAMLVVLGTAVMVGGLTGALWT